MSRPSRRHFLAAAAAALAPRGASAADPPPAPVADLAAGNTAFGMDLYAHLAAAPGNLFLSPFSISAALAMAAAGARGDTLAEMRKVLRFPGDPAATHAAFGKLFKAVTTPDAVGKPAYELSVANALWAQKGYPWRAAYKQTVSAIYGAGLFDVDFVGNPEAARGQINHWVEGQTRDKIKDLLAKGIVTTDTRLVLTNAIYFKGTWASTFDKDATRDLPFRLADGGKVDAPLMFRKGGYSYTEGDGFQALELPYKGNRLGMVVVLPAAPDGLPAVEKALTGDALAKTLANLKYEREVLVHLPRFKAEKSFNLNEPLKALGMKAAFTPAADFGGMSDGGPSLSVSDVVHKAFVDVNETGTEAAAATAVVVGLTSAPAQPPKPKVFRADRPFLFLIRDRQTNSVLFLGRLTHPKA